MCCHYFQQFTWGQETPLWFLIFIFPYSLLLLIELIGVTLGTKLGRFQVRSSTTFPPVHCTVCSPLQVQSLPITIYLPLPSSTSSHTLALVITTLLSVSMKFFPLFFSSSLPLNFWLVCILNWTGSLCLLHTSHTYNCQIKHNKNIYKMYRQSQKQVGDSKFQ